jgi:RNA polymerase sigma-54 factor
MTLSQVLAPQLQQSLALLQAPTLELKALVEQELQQNPILEEVPAAEVELSERIKLDGASDSDPSDLAEPPPDVKFDPATEQPSSAPVDDFQAEFEKLAQFDQEWRDHFTQTNLPVRQSQETEERRQYMFDSLVARTSLQESLLEQMRFSEMTEEQKPIAEMIIGNVDDRGYLKATVDELAFSTNIAPEKIWACSRSSRNSIPPAWPRATSRNACCYNCNAPAGKRPSSTASFMITWRRSLNGSCPKSRAGLP